MNNERKFIFRSCMIAVLIALVAFLGRFGSGAVSAVLLLYGCYASATGKRGIVLSCFILYPVLLTLNPILFPMAEVGAIINRVSTLIVALVLAVTAANIKGNNQLPLVGMLPYLLIAGISSVQGYFPSISYMKIVNFCVFLLGIWIGSRNMQHSPRDLETLRVFIMGLATFMIVGSLVAYIFFPSATYFQSLREALHEGGTSYATEVYRSTLANVGDGLFAGITNQSQCLGPMLSAIVLWVISDMLFIEKRFSMFHSFLVVIGLYLMYLTKSRTSILAFLAGWGVLSFYVLRHINVSWSMKGKLKHMALLGGAVILLMAVFSEIRNRSMTRWIWKSSDVANDNRSFIEAVTSSRQRLIDQNWEDFHYNEILGCGFQVEQSHIYIYRGRKGLIFSAPIEKGVLPLMVLGETGVVGFVAFMIFLVSFYSGCARKRLYVTIMLFSVMLASNFGEADFFSPGGIGGAKWVLCVVGGFMIDTNVLHQKRCEMMGYLGYGV